MRRAGIRESSARVPAPALQGQTSSPLEGMGEITRTGCPATSPVRKNGGKFAKSDMGRTPRWRRKRERKRLASALPFLDRFRGGLKAGPYSQHPIGTLRTMSAAEV